MTDHRTLRSALTPDQREDLAQLESLTTPSDLQRGELRAIRLCAGEHDRKRAEQLEQRWAVQS